MENAFITIYVRKSPAETAKNLLNLAIDSNIGDLTALEFIINALVSKGDISPSTVRLFSIIFLLDILLNYDKLVLFVLDKTDV